MSSGKNSIAKIRIIYSATMCFLVGLSLYVFLQIKNLTTSSDLVNYTHQLTLTLHKITGAIVEAETNQRGFILTGDSSLLSRRNSALNLLRDEVRLVDSLAANNPDQIENLQQLHNAIDGKIRNMNNVLTGYAPVQMSAELQNNILEGVKKMDEVKKAVSEMTVTENHLLEFRQKDYSHQSFITPFFVAALFLGALAILFSSYFRINSELRESQRLQATLESERTFAQTILDSSPDNILVLDRELRYVSANPKAREVLKRIDPDFIGKKLSDLFPNADFKDDMAKALNGQTVRIDDYYSEHTRNHYDVSYTPLKDTKGVIGIIGQSRNISGILKTKLQLEKQNEALEKRGKLLKESEEKFNSLFQLSPFSITLADSTEKIIDVNENSIKTFGYSREELIGKTIADLGIINQENRDTISEKLHQHGTVNNMEAEVTDKKGVKIPVLISIEKILMNGKHYYLTAINEIIAQKKAQAELEQSNVLLKEMNKELQAFAYISSHDLQEPLRKIQTFSSRILDKEFNALSSNAKDNFSRIQGSAKRMQGLIEDLLLYSRTNNSERNFETVDLGKIVDEVKDEMKEQLAEKNGIIITGEMCDIKVIRFQFRQLLTNLFSNSLKFARPGVVPEITISSDHVSFFFTARNERITGSFCHISVDDNGIGFEQDYNERIFEVFQRLHSKEKYAGTGIGLAIVKKIVDNHNGTIRATGQLNHGARFDIYIPAASPKRS